MYVKFYFFTAYKFNTYDRAKNFFDVLLRFGGIYVPEKYSEYEPIRDEFDPSDLEKPIKILSSPSYPKRGSILLKRDHPIKWLMGIDWDTFSQTFHKNYFFIDEKYFSNENNISSFLNFAKEIYVRFNAVYASSGLEVEYEDKNIVQRKEQIGNTIAEVRRFYGNDITKNIPGVYWANFFGKKYVEFFGEKLYNAPGFRKELIDNGGILILTSKSPLEYPEEQMVNCQNNLRKVLGEEAFLDIKYPNRECISLDFSNELGQ